MWFFTLPEAGDIVWCRFPEKAMGRPGPKPRPAMVIDLGTLHGDPAIEAIYGTSQKLERLYAGELAITPEDGIAYRASGLSRATKFDMYHSVFLPYNDVWFGVPPGAPHGQTPKLGILHPSLMHRAQAAYAARRKRWGASGLNRTANIPLGMQKRAALQASYLRCKPLHHLKPLAVLPDELSRMVQGHPGVLLP